jgi:glutaconyl-CoA/methylmalonyl-CoA decarboxylase subunit gamma
MRIVIERDGRTETVDVTPAGDAVTVGRERYPVVVVRASPTSVELEIAGERVVVENWPEHFPEPPGPVDVNGERWKVRVERSVGPGTHAPPPVSPKMGEAAPTPPDPGPAVAGTPIVPPMPGRVIEVRVKEGDRVEKGAVLLVLEAMKMRNEITSPTDGFVRRLTVSAGTNARAKEPMLYVAPA